MKDGDTCCPNDYSGWNFQKTSFVSFLPELSQHRDKGRSEQIQTN